MGEREGGACTHTHGGVKCAFKMEIKGAVVNAISTTYPKLCVASLRYGVCNRARCSYYHLTGTKQPHLNHRGVNRSSDNGHRNNFDSQEFKDSRIQINLFASTNTFCYGINKQDIQYNLQDKLKLLIATDNQNYECVIAQYNLNKTINIRQMCK